MTREEINRIVTEFKERIGEHCNGFVFIGEFEVDGEEPGDTGGASTLHTWAGGVNMAAGLVERMRVRMAMEIEAADGDMYPIQLVEPPEDWENNEDDEC